MRTRSDRPRIPYAPRPGGPRRETFLPLNLSRPLPLLALAALFLSAAPAPAQEREREEWGRREERERCVCFSVPEPGGFAFFGPGEAQQHVRLGVQVSARPDPATDSVGARIEGVIPSSPAEEAGLREGDIIVSIDGRRLVEPLEDEDLDEDESAPAQRLIRLARELVPGDTVRIVYRRNGEKRQATLEARRVRTPRAFSFRMPAVPRAPEVRPFRPPSPAREGRRFEAPRLELEWFRGRVAGLEVVEMSQGLGEYFGTDSGVLVTEVDDDSPLPLQPGDVILKVDGREVEDARHLRDILRSYRSDEPVTLEIMRKRERMTVTGPAR